MNYYPHHIGDFKSATANMPRLQRWIYRDMLEAYYDKEMPLPLDFEELCEILGTHSIEEQSVVKRLLRFKFEKTEFGFRHEICEQVIADYHKKASIAVENGKRGGRPPKINKTQKKPSGFQSGSNPDATGNQQETGSKANQEPITNNQEPDKNKKPPAIADDELFPGVDLQVIADFKALRKTKKAAITLTAMQNIAGEAAKAGMSLEDALRVCCSRGWQGFRADWVEPSSSPAKNNLQVRNLDHSSTVAAAAASREKHGIVVPEGNQEIEF